MISNDSHIQSFERTCCVPDLNQDSEDESNLGCEQETESPTSVLDVAFSDHTMLDESSSLDENIVHSNEVDDSVGDVNDLNVQESNLSDLNDFSLQEADPKNEAVLNYVKDIFSKSSFTNETLFDTWRSQNIAALEDEGCQHHDLSFSAAVESDLAIADMCADEFLLFDLTNEALLDMYRKYAARSRFASRPKPVGQNALRELCSRVSCQLDDQQTWFGLDVDGLLSSDLAKADRWVEFRGDGDQVGEKVADLVLDRLVTELALQLIKF